MCLQCLEQYLEGGPERLQMPLREKYGDPYRISNVYLKKINEWPTIWTGDEQALNKFSVFLTQRRGAITKLTFLSILNHPLNLQSMVALLPSQLQDRWCREASRTRMSVREIPALGNFVKFVNAKASVANDLVFSQGTLCRVDSSMDQPYRFVKGKGI